MFKRADYISLPLFFSTEGEFYGVCVKIVVYETWSVNSWVHHVHKCWASFAAQTTTSAVILLLAIYYLFTGKDTDV